MKTRRITVVILLALVLAALLPLSAAAEPSSYYYIYGEVRAGEPGGASNGVVGATVELYFQGRLIRQATTTSTTGAFGFGVAGTRGTYVIKVAVPAGYTPREVYFGGAPAFTIDPSQIGFSVTGVGGFTGGATGQMGPFVFWNDGEIPPLPPEEYPDTIGIFGQAQDKTTGALISGVLLKLTRNSLPAREWLKNTKPAGYFYFGIKSQLETYTLEVVSLPAGYTQWQIKVSDELWAKIGEGAQPAVGGKMQFQLPPNMANVGPFIIEVSKAG